MNIFSREIKLLSGQLESLAEEDEDVKLLMTVPGIGYYSALLVKSEIGDVCRFPFPERLCSYAGLVPSTYASGRTVRHGGITKEGSRWLRWLRLRLLKHTFTSKRGKKVATVAVARRLLMCSYSVLKNKKPYYDQA